MRSEEEIKSLAHAIRVQVDMYRERGISKPQTPLERAAFEEGRLFVLEWLLGDESDDAKVSAGQAR